MERYDVVIIGSGPGGERAAEAAAFFGKRVAVVEKSLIGGASTNTGTIPSKTLRETALALSGLRARNLYGVDLSLRREATISDFMHHEENVKESERERVRASLRQYDIAFLPGLGSFVDPHTIRIAGPDGSEMLVECACAVIATGSSPIRPSGFDFSNDRIHDSDEILALKTLPTKLAVVGAGIVGSEYACTFAALGVQVHLVDGRPGLLPFLDEDVSLCLRQCMEELGVTFHQPERVTSCAVQSGGTVELVCESGFRLVVDGVLVAAGRRSNTDQLNLGATGITPGEKGLIPVNKQFQSSVPHIYAVGDVIGFPALAATSAAQGRLAMAHAFDVNFRFSMAPILPSGIYTIPEVSVAGESEKDLQSKGIPHIVGKVQYRRNARGKIIGEKDGFLKLLFKEDDMKLLGVQAIGEHATDLIHVGLIGLRMGADAKVFAETCFNYPTLGDLYYDAAYQAWGKRYLMDKQGASPSA